MADPTSAPISAEDAALQKEQEAWRQRQHKYLEELKKQYPELNVEPDPNFLSGTREEQMERMAKHVEEVARVMGEPNANAPIPGNEEPWWKTFINFEADLKETVDEKTRKELDKVTQRMYSEGLTPEAITKAREEGEKLLSEYPSIVEKVKAFLFNDESLKKMREFLHTNAAEGKPGLFPYPLGNKGEVKEEELVESLD
ncbi:hypothetical protein QBC34DRAFT_150439 [Podospora aff. communis PSN243]|uniref:Uncharacterized protein n=1 Tax=Podospora aff. communis PSN243 TaxID=3040156 RepID=A0AAV9GE43_9PEZI|nr:hypothetical protein QBC34DRAFT_150439 [Podospora aff. communis PSN243]